MKMVCGKLVWAALTP
ncbi:hypothetical protein M2G36_21730 [Vibrio vulnificus]|nr:hypothetical protein [Vibrio vulnificus]MCU8102870.1 hypothetical protein [Vibrio vulnificus]MCU8215056.1 hypothetical protein [Vibrio vulnificus]MCU8562374.1 hypothetical protein [Vibrio vulnificus]